MSPFQFFGHSDEDNLLCDNPNAVGRFCLATVGLGVRRPDGRRDSGKLGDRSVDSARPGCAVAPMGLSAAIARLEQRIRAVSLRDPVHGETLQLDLQIIRGYFGSPVAERIATLVFALFERLEAHDRANAPAARRRRITPHQAAEAVRLHGGIRAAARMLQVSHMTVARKIRMAHVPPRASDTSLAGRS